MLNISEFLNNYRGGKLLTVLPHADDACYIAGGLFQLLERLNIKSKYICLVSEPSSEELAKSSEIIGIDETVVYDTKKGRLGRDKSWVLKLKKELINYDPDVVLTFDPHGITGHPDHKVSSVEVLNMIKDLKKPPEIIWRTADESEKKYFDTGHNFHFSVTPNYQHNLSLVESYKKLMAIFTFKKKFKSLLYKMQVLEWYLFDHKELYYKVDLKKDKFELNYI